MKAFTDASVRGAKPTLSDRMEVGDPSCRGLYLRVTSAGARSFSFRARPPGGGRVERLTLGTYPDLSLRDARLKADRLRRQIADGKNPFAHKHEAPTRSFAALAERYIDEYAIRHKRSFAKDQRNLRLHILPRWRDRDYASITRADVIQLIERIVAASKPVLANHVHALVRGIFSFAMDVDLMAANPAARLRKRGVERIKTRVLTDDEIRLFWTRSVEAPIVRLFGLALRLVLVTGVRSGEAAGMARGEINSAPMVRRSRGQFLLGDQRTAARILCRCRRWRAPWWLRRWSLPAPMLISSFPQLPSAAIPTAACWLPP